MQEQAYWDVLTCVMTIGVPLYTRRCFIFTPIKWPNLSVVSEFTVSLEAIKLSTQLPSLQ